ncbi:MAG: nicotinate (nicotinamide) nucleotide adenylyltransferase [Spirochaetes bacterium]|nr:nicotinate (nicotinamide) nucleotide adenylyltransferase [Spirochaetota bacterium]
MGAPQENARLALFGGSFNPPHLGHRALLEAYHRRHPAHQVLLVPCRQPPHKAFEKSVSDAHRLALSRLLVADHDWVTVDELELRREGPSYTFETLIELEARFRPQLPIHLLIGDDLVESLPTWKAYPNLCARVQWVCFTRRGLTDSEHHRIGAALEKALPGGHPFRLEWIAMPPVAMASSEIRKALAARAPGARGNFLPEQWAYLAKNRLYGAMLE